MSNKKDTQAKSKENKTKIEPTTKEFVIVESGSKQYILEQGSVISIEKIVHPKDGKVKLDTVLLHSKNDNVSIGAPYLDLVVNAEIIQDEKDKKIRVFKFKKKTGYKKTQGHRQVYTTIRVLSFDKPTASSKTTKPKESSTKESTNKETKK
ncbi:50S ribosomal protein L21 [bacterium]|nr:50S ribosomal protein L21 [bacterium]